MGSIVRVDFDNPGDFDRWQACITSREDTHCTDLGQWRSFFRELYGIRNYSYLYVSGGKSPLRGASDGKSPRGASDIRGLVSLYHFRSPFMGDFLITSPFFGYGGFYADDEVVRDALLEKVRAKAVELGVDYVELRLLSTLPPPFKAADNFLESNLDLLETSEQVWTRQLASNVRQNIRRAGRSDLELRWSRDHRPCYRLLCRTLRAHGTPFHGEAMFELLREYFPGETSFTEVWHRGELVAGGVIMDFGDSLITPYIGSLKQHGRLRANYCQYWGIAEYCLEHGVPRFELGRSPKGSTHIRFKRKWGAEDVAVRYNYLVVNPKKSYRGVPTLPPVYRLATEAWKRLPLGVTTLLGPRLARHVP